MTALLQRLGTFLGARPDVDTALESIQRTALEKARPALPVGIPLHPLRSLQLDPFALVAAMGYKDRRSSLSYDVLRRIARQLTVVAAILQRRVSQVAAFSAPYRVTKSLGFEIKHRDPEHQTTRGEKDLIKALEQFISTCGEPQAIGSITRAEWDPFETFLRKFTRDSLVLDQGVFEVVPDRSGRPCAFTAIDAATIRIAVTDEDLVQAGAGSGVSAIETTQRAMGNPQVGPYGRARALPAPEHVDYVQVYQGQIVNAYSREELAFCVRNPRTDLLTNGYGSSELETLVQTVTSLLWAEEYNRNFFKNGSIPKGLLNFKTDTPDPESLEAFKTYWTAQVAGVNNAWRLPMFQSEGLEYINLQLSNRDMEFQQWVEYLLKLATALYGMDPSEINFDIARAGSSQPLFESPSEHRLSDSKENGLRPLLRFIARMINRHILARLDDRFTFDFVGLDELSEPEKMQLRTQEITTYKMIDEVRAEADLPALSDGSGQIVLNPVWAQFQQMRMQAAQQQQGQDQPGPGGAGAAGDDAAAESESDSDSAQPKAGASARGPQPDSSSPLMNPPIPRSF